MLPPRHRSAKQARLEILGLSDLPGVVNRRRLGEQASPPFLLLAGLITLGIGLGIAHNRWQAHHRTDPALAVAGTMLYPFQRSAAGVQNAAVFNFGSLFQGKRLAADNARLSAEVSRLRQENEALQAKAAAADRLRAALGLIHRSDSAPLPAEVIGWLPSPSMDTITVARGTRGGVQAGFIARTPSGLLGQVIESGPLSCQVLLLTDVGSGVGAIIRHNGKPVRGAVGIVWGTGRSQNLELRDISRDAEMHPGDQVITSGFGGVIPPDIPIGTIAAVHSDKAGFLQEASVTPAAPLPDDVREVLLIKSLPEPEMPPPPPVTSTPQQPRPASSSPASAPAVGKPSLQ